MLLTTEIKFDQIASPKINSSDPSRLFYKYYAGYSEAFVEDVLRYLHVSSGHILVDPWNGAGTTTTVAGGLGIKALGYDLNPALGVIGKVRATKSSIAVKFLERLARQGTQSFRAFLSGSCTAWQKPIRGFLFELESFGDKLLVRMQDLKLICEIIHAILFGIRTTNKRALYHLYKDHDDKFKEQSKIKKYFEHAFEVISKLGGIHSTNIMKPYMAYSLVLAIIHSKYGLRKLTGVGPGHIRGNLKLKLFEERLLELDEALETPDGRSQNILCEWADDLADACKIMCP